MALMTFHRLGMSSSQLTNSIIFQRGRSITNQIRSARLPFALKMSTPAEIYHETSRDFESAMQQIVKPGDIIDRGSAAMGKINNGNGIDH